MLPVHSHDVDGDLSDCNVEKCLTVQNSDSDLQTSRFHRFAFVSMLDS